MSVGAYLSPLGAAGAGTPVAPLTTKYITPATTSVPIYVYATIDTGGAALSASNVAGLEYLYYNLAAASTGTAKIPGVVTATLNTKFAGFGSQVGTLAATVGSGSTASNVGTGVGSSPFLGGSTLTDYAKPRNGDNSAYSTLTSDGTNVIVSGTKVSFLVETLSFTPSNFTASTAGSLKSTTFTLSTPTITTPYSGSNYFSGLAGTPTPGTPLAAGAANTFSTYSAIHASVTIIDTVPGDLNADGQVNDVDFGTFAGNYSPTSGLGHTYGQGDLNNDGRVNDVDFGTFAGNYNVSLGALPASAVAASAVPEPASLSVVGLLSLGLLGRRRKA
jgi:hypothetical protein